MLVCTVPASKHHNSADQDELNLGNFRGPDWKEFSEPCVWDFSKEKQTKCPQGPVWPPLAQLNWTGPITNNSENRLSYKLEIKSSIGKPENSDPNCVLPCLRNGLLPSSGGILYLLPQRASEAIDS